jgi:hypothetical protein
MILDQLGRGPLRGREPVQARRPLRGQSCRAEVMAEVFELRPALRVARARLHLAERA